MIDDSEYLERTVLEDLHRAASPAVAASLGLRPQEIGGAFVSLAAGLPPSGIVINRAIGLGAGEPATEDGVREIVAAYHDAGVQRYFVHLHPEAVPPALPGWLAAAGLVPARGWQKFERPPSAPAEAHTDLAIRRIGAEHGEDFARIACNAFDLGDAARAWLRALPGRQNWHVFMSFDGDSPAGTGAIYVAEGMAWFDFGATDPAFRQRGSQAALLARRIGHAMALGCHRLLTCTGKAVPGDPQHSYRNLLKAGFRETYARANYAPPRP